MNCPSHADCMYPVSFVHIQTYRKQTYSKTLTGNITCYEKRKNEVRKLWLTQAGRSSIIWMPYAHLNNFLDSFSPYFLVAVLLQSCPRTDMNLSRAHLTAEADEYHLTHLTAEANEYEEHKIYYAQY